MAFALLHSFAQSSRAFWASISCVLVDISSQSRSSILSTVGRLPLIVLCDFGSLSSSIEWSRVEGGGVGIGDCLSVSGWVPIVGEVAARGVVWPEFGRRKLKGLWGGLPSISTSSFWSTGFAGVLRFEGDGNTASLWLLVPPLESLGRLEL